MAQVKNLLFVGALALVIQSTVLAEDLSEVILAIRSADLDRVEQLIQAKKYSKAEYEALIAEADQIVTYNDATFNKKWAGINSIGGTLAITALGSWEMYKILTAQNDNDRIYYGLSALFSFAVCLPICLWSVYRYRKNCSNAEKATKISEALYAAKARLK